MIETDNPSEARAYGLSKAHKKLEEGNKIPPLRLVISGCGSNTENASFYVKSPYQTHPREFKQPYFRHSTFLKDFRK